MLLRVLIGYIFLVRHQQTLIHGIMAPIVDQRKYPAQSHVGEPMSLFCLLTKLLVMTPRSMADSSSCFIEKSIPSTW